MIDPAHVLRQAAQHNSRINDLERKVAQLEQDATEREVTIARLRHDIDELREAFAKPPRWSPDMRRC